MKKQPDRSDYFPFLLNQQQSTIFEALKKFVTENEGEQSAARVFILKGYAGTGKTSLMAGLIRHMEATENPYTLLASTGRAAKILSDKTGVNAKTIHSHIYLFNGLNEDLETLSHQLELADSTGQLKAYSTGQLKADSAGQPKADSTGQLSLVFGLRPIDAAPNRLYIVDEASMVSDMKEKGASFASFGSGELLHDLMTYDRNGKFIFVGDPIQLPPVSQSLSPALTGEYIVQKYHCQVIEHELTAIIRQQTDSGIITASMHLRKAYLEDKPVKFARFSFRLYPDIQLHHTYSSLVNTYLERVKEHGFDHATLICQTNRHCSLTNRYIRNALKKSDERVEREDILLVTQNNYLCNLVNGDIVEVMQVGKAEIRGNLSFKQVRVRELGRKEIIGIRLIEDILYSAGTNLDSLQNRDLMIDFFHRMKARGISQKDPVFKDMMRQDPYLNALKAVYGYALTCHKSQGGEWEEVFLYLDNKIQGMPKPAVYQWMYTAVTRAKKTLHLVDDWFIQ